MAASSSILYGSHNVFTQHYAPAFETMLTAN